MIAFLIGICIGSGHLAMALLVLLIAIAVEK